MRTLSSYLIYTTPNVRRLECFGDTIGEGDLLRLLVDVARASPGSTDLPLQHLRSVEVKLAPNIDEDSLPAGWLLSCIHLPRLETFAASMINGVAQHSNLDNIPISNITKIVLQASTFDADKLIQVLSKTNCLKSFAHENGQDQLVYQGGVTIALIEYAGHCLEHLAMRRQDQETPLCTESGEELLYVSLAVFKRLKTLRCSTYLLTSDPLSPQPNEPLTSGPELVACSSDEYKEAIKNNKNDDYLQATPKKLRRPAFASRLPPSLTSLHFEDYLCHTPLVHSARSEFVLKVDGLLPRLKQVYISDWGLQYLENKGVLGIVAQPGLKYRQLPNPFTLGISHWSSPDIHSGSEDESDEDPGI